MGGHGERGSGRDAGMTAEEEEEEEEGLGLFDDLFILKKP